MKTLKQIISITLAVGFLSISQMQTAQADVSGKSYDPRTGITTTASRNAKGITTIVRTDRNGRVLSREVKRPQRVSYASSRDPRSGATVTSRRNLNGTRTVVKRDRFGRVLSARVVR